MDLFEEQKGRIQLSLTVEEESREWYRLTEELTLCQANLTNIPLDEGVDYPLKFKVSGGSPKKSVSGVEELILEDPKSMGGLVSWRKTILIDVSLSGSSC